MKQYRLFHRVSHAFRNVLAKSAQEACTSVGWLIDDAWVREETRGKYANGWRNITKRKTGAQIKKG